MNKSIIMVAFALILGATASQTAKAQNDTTLVKTAKQIEWVKDTTTDKAGETKTQYYVTIDGKTYKSNKTSAVRYELIKRHGGQPCLVYIKNTKGTRVATL